VSAEPDVEKQQASPGGLALYDPDPTHLWNRLHQALHFRLTDLGGPDNQQELLPGDRAQHAFELDALLWPIGSSYLRFGEPRITALSLLDEFLAKEGDKLVRDPCKRAFLQRDLWALFDWTRSGYADVPGRDLRARLAKAIQRLALSPEEIKGLPDNFAAVAASKKLAEFPENLWDSQGPWVLLGDDNKNTNGARTITPVHDSFFGGRSAFLVFEKKGTASAALVRRMLLIDNQGRIRLTPITESVQIRGDGARQEFKLNRKDFLEGRIQQSILAVSPDDQERSDIVFLGNNVRYSPALILRSCFECHQRSDLNSRTQAFSGKVGPMRARPRLVASSLDDEVAKCVRWKYDQFMWGKLQGLWEGHTP
jgi:hypothetical protein